MVGCILYAGKALNPEKSQRIPMFGFVYLKKPILLTTLLTACWGGGGMSAQAGPLMDPATAVGLVPHKALYDIRLNSARSGSQVVNIRGQMLFEWKPSCEGWITDHRFRLYYDYADAPAMNIESDFSTFESFDQDRLDFSSRRRKDGEVYEELRGHAALEQKEGIKGKSGKAIYTVPAGLQFDLAAGTMFSTEHTISLLKSARQGSKFMKGAVFDGSDDEGPVEINSFIGKSFAKGSRDVLGLGKDVEPPQKQQVDTALIDVPGWKISMAFFPIKSDDPSSDYELTMAFHENGIISDMLVDYGDFKVSQHLVALEKVAPESCGK
jgi:hypothetical protein